MDWTWLAVGLVGGYCFGFIVGKRETARSLKPSIDKLNSDLAHDRNLVIQLIRRELANWMIRQDPDRYLQIYKSIRLEEIKISSLSKPEKQAQHARITDECPFYDDLEFIGTREYVLYSDALGNHSFDDVERHYRNVALFQALQISLDIDWKYFQGTTDKELSHIEGYIQQFKDDQFKKRLKQAFRELEDHQGFIMEQRGESITRIYDFDKILYETSIFGVRRIKHLYEIRYGIHFKDTNEFGLVSIFADDKMYESLYRSNSSFDNSSAFHDIGRIGD